MLNVGGGELIALVLIGLIALGPEQLPVMMRRVGSASARINALRADVTGEFLNAVRAGADAPEGAVEDGGAPSPPGDDHAPRPPGGRDEPRSITACTDPTRAAHPRQGDGIDDGPPDSRWQVRR